MENNLWISEDNPCHLKIEYKQNDTDYSEQRYKIKLSVKERDFFQIWYGVIIMEVGSQVQIIASGSESEDRWECVML